MLSTEEVSKSAFTDLSSRSREGVTNMLAARASGMVVGLLSSAVMGRLPGPSAYGLVAMATSVMILLNLLKDFGLTTAVVQADLLETDQIDAVFYWPPAPS